MWCLQSLYTRIKQGFPIATARRSKKFEAIRTAVLLRALVCVNAVRAFHDTSSTILTFQRHLLAFACPRTSCCGRSHTFSLVPRWECCSVFRLFGFGFLAIV